MIPTVYSLCIRAAFEQNLCVREASDPPHLTLLKKWGYFIFVYFEYQGVARETLRTYIKHFRKSRVTYYVPKTFLEKPLIDTSTVPIPGSLACSHQALALHNFLDGGGQHFFAYAYAHAS